MTLVIINWIMFMFITKDQEESEVELFEQINTGFLVIFCFEAILKLVSMKLNYF